MLRKLRLRQKNGSLIKETCNQLINSHLMRFGILKLKNRVTQNDVTLQVINSKFFTGILFSSY